jgi:hypothetical protein
LQKILCLQLDNFTKSHLRPGLVASLAFKLIDVIIEAIGATHHLAAHLVVDEAFVQAERQAEIM